MRCSEFEILISGFLDGELDNEQSLILDNHLLECESCRIELERARSLKEALDRMAVRTPEDEFWDGYWAGIYNRMERQVGWLFCAIGAILLVSFGLIVLFREVLFSEGASIWVSLGGTVSIIGVAILLISVARERLRINRHERYKDVRR